MEHRGGNGPRRSIKKKKDDRIKQRGHMGIKRGEKRGVGRDQK